MVYKPSLGLGQKDTENREKRHAQATGEVIEMVGDAISAESSSTDNVNTNIKLRVIYAAAGVELPMLSGRSQGSKLYSSRGRSTC